MTHIKSLLKNIDKAILILPFIFAAISIVMLGSTAYRDSFVFSGDMKRQLAAFVIGVIAVVVTQIFDYKRLARLPMVMYVITLLFLLSVYTPLGSEQYGTRGWLDLGVANLQPSELCKIPFIVIMAAYLSKAEHEPRSVFGIIKAMLFAAPFIGIVLLQNDLGNALVYGIILMMMLIAADADYGAVTKIVLPVALLSPILYRFLQFHQKQRILAFFNPNDLNLPGNYHVWQSKIAIGSGGLTGKGLFMGTQKQLDWLPVSKSDFIFAVICEELGFIGGAIIICLFAFFLFRIFKVALLADDYFGKLIALGVLAMFFIQVFENIGMTMGLMPVTGITLPFISYGGSSMLANMFALALIVNVNMRSRMITF